MSEHTSTIIDRAKPFLAPALTAVLVLLVLFLRRPDLFLNPQFYAEDGLVFYKEGRLLGIDAFFMPYAGFYLLYPRIVAWTANTFFSPALAPTIYVAGSALAVLMVVGYLFSPRLHLPYPWLLALLIVAAPTRGEVFLTLCHTMWILSLLLVLLSISDPPATPWQKAFDLGVLFISAFTGPFIFFFTPLFAARALIKRQRFDVMLFLYSILCSIIQIANLNSARGPGVFEPFNYYFLPVIARIAGLGFFGLKDGGSVDPTDTTLVLLLCAFVALLYVGLAYLLHRAKESRGLMMLFASVLILGAVLVSIRNDPKVLLGGGQRYFYLETVLLLWACAASLKEIPVACGSVLAAAFLPLLFYSSSYVEIKLVDFRWKKASRCIGGEHSCHLKINPPGWEISLPPEKKPRRN